MSARTRRPIAAGVYASARAMLLSERDSTAVLLVLLATVPVAVAVGWVIARRVRALDRPRARWAPASG